jgi:hypothetical protein
MHAIDILQPRVRRSSVSMEVSHNDGGGTAMNPEHPAAEILQEKDEITAAQSRLLDEKISDESGAEAQTDSALAPAGLNNPFWN